jgi:hypothetical protein
MSELQQLVASDVFAQALTRAQREARNLESATDTAAHAYRLLKGLQTVAQRAAVTDRMVRPGPMAERRAG